MRKSIVALWALIATALSTHALAQTNATTMNTTPIESSTTPNQVAIPSNNFVSPSSVGNPHICLADQWYPRSAVLANESGTTILNFRIGTDGLTRNFSVSKSSGYSDLDDAAMKCAATWRYEPATKDGTPVEITWSAKINWFLSGHFQPGPGVDTPPHGDRGTHFCGEMIPVSQSATTVLSLHIDENGFVTGADVIASSGNSELDEKARACETTSQRFTPATSNGNPTKSGLIIHVHQQSPPPK